MKFMVTISPFLVLPLVRAYWIFAATNPLVTTRLDSIVSPGVVSTHVHAIAGGSRFQPTYDFNDLIKSECSTINVQPDKSNYWAPQLYYHDQTANTFTTLQTDFNIYYLPRPGSNNESIQAFPTGLRMLAGNPNRRVNNASNFEDQAISFVCLDFENDHTGDPAWDERPDFFAHQCPDGMRAQIFFPSCWDGVNLDSADHKSHMAYPIDNYNSGNCPSSHPIHLISLFYEMIVQVQQFPYSPGSLVFSFGDNGGLGLHGDFQDGWEDKVLLQQAIDTCPDANGNVANCPPLNAVIDNTAAAACKPELDIIVNEDIGMNSLISTLPGCNPIWVGTGPKPTCNPEPPTPGFISPNSPLPTGWTELGCIAEGTSGRALSAASTTNATMTKTLCANYCGGLGYSLAGVEFGRECYCGPELTNGAAMVFTSWEDCSSTCSGNVNEDCGGPNRLNILQKN